MLAFLVLMHTHDKSLFGYNNIMFIYVSTDHIHVLSLPTSFGLREACLGTWAVQLVLISQQFVLQQVLGTLHTQSPCLVHTASETITFDMLCCIFYKCDAIFILTESLFMCIRLGAVIIHPRNVDPAF